MPTYLQDGVGISGGSSLIGGTGLSENLLLISTSNSDKGSVIIAPYLEESIVSGRTYSLAISNSANLFSGVTPKMEILTGISSNVDYKELVVIRHAGIDSTARSRQVGLLLKLSDESNEVESNKTGGLMLESTDSWANNPELSLVLKNSRSLTVHFDGTVVVPGNFKVYGNTNLAPIGSYLFMSVEFEFDDYLRCDGSSHDRSSYPDLFNVIGTTYGSEDEYSFNVPDSRGLFFRDLDNYRGIDPGRLLSNTMQNDEFAEHYHTYTRPTANGSATGNAISHPDGPLIEDSTSSVGGSETRPKNIAIVAYIKSGFGL